MEKKAHPNITCPFGPALIELRTMRGISQSRLSIMAECNVTNLRKIEKGSMQPGVSMAVRLVAATGTDVGDFFQKLAEDNGLLPLPGASGSGGMTYNESDFIKGIHLPGEKIPKGTRSIFGVMFKEVRAHYGVTQKTVAEKAHYNLRNILNVESGNQEPGIMTALAMVCATGADVKDFFEQLCR